MRYDRSRLWAFAKQQSEVTGAPPEILMYWWMHRGCITKIVFEPKSGKPKVVDLFLNARQLIALWLECAPYFATQYIYEGAPRSRTKTAKVLEAGGEEAERLRKFFGSTRRPRRKRVRGYGVVPASEKSEPVSTAASQAMRSPAEA